MLTLAIISRHIHLHTYLVDAERINWNYHTTITQI